GGVVVVTAGLLVVEPADQPDVDVQVAIELHVDALVPVVAYQGLPELRPVPDRRRQLDELRPLQIALLRAPPDDEVPELVHASSEVGLSRQRALVTAGPKPR